MAAVLIGADVRALSASRNRVLPANKTPTGLNRGFGGPQVDFAPERLLHRIAVTLGIDPLDVIRRNVIPANAFPYRTATGAAAGRGRRRPARRPISLAAARRGNTARPAR